MEFDIPVVKEVMRKGRVSKETLSLNTITSRHYRVYQEHKKRIYGLLHKQLNGTEPKGLDKVTALHYVVGCTGKQDVMNIGAAADKVFQDFLIEVGVLKNDTVHNINYVTFSGVHSPGGAFVRVRIEL